MPAPHSTRAASNARQAQRVRGGATQVARHCAAAASTHGARRGGGGVAWPSTPWA